MNTSYLYLNTRDEFYRVDVSKIVFFEGDGNYTKIMLSNRQQGVVGMNLGQMQRILSESLKERASIFARVGKRFIINLTHVYRIEVQRQKLTLSDGALFAFQLPVSKDALRKLKEMYVGSRTSSNKEE